MATATKTLRRRIQLNELASGVGELAGGQQRVDAEHGVIRRVRIIGTHSENGRRYTPEALRKAIPLYARVKIKLNHPQRPDDPRPIDQTIGWLEAIAQGEDGALYGDLHVLLSHPYAKTLCEIAQRNPALLGLSHNAEGSGKVDDAGVFIVEEIERVISVDLVDEPATNSSLFEQRKPMKKTLRKRLEEAAVKMPAQHAKSLRKMLAEEDMPAEVLDEADEMGGEEDWMACLKDAVSKLAGTAGHDKAKKIMAMMEPEKAVEEEDDSEDEDMEESEDSDQAKGVEDKDEKKGDLPGPSDKRTKESRTVRRKPADDTTKALREEFKVRDLIDEADLTFANHKAKRAFIESLVPLGDASRKALIEERKELAKAQTAAAKQPPRSQSRHTPATPIPEQREADVNSVKDTQSFIAFLKS